MRGRQDGFTLIELLLVLVVLGLVYGIVFFRLDHVLTRYRLRGAARDVLATMRVTSGFDRSTAEQFVTLHRNVDTIDCVFRINWQQRYTMLKLAYETRIADGEASYDTALAAATAARASSAVSTMGTTMPHAPASRTRLM